jgi:hypothetical protein
LHGCCLFYAQITVYSKSGALRLGAHGNSS